MRSEKSPLLTFSPGHMERLMPLLTLYSGSFWTELFESPLGKRLYPPITSLIEYDIKQISPESLLRRAVRRNGVDLAIDIITQEFRGQINNLLNFQLFSDDLKSDITPVSPETYFIAQKKLDEYSKILELALNNLAYIEKFLQILDTWDKQKLLPTLSAAALANLETIQDTHTQFNAFALKQAADFKNVQIIAQEKLTIFWGNQ